MRLAQIDYARCEACSPCPARKACRTKAIVKPSDCMGCGDCVEECPYEAVSMKES